MKFKRVMCTTVAWKRITFFTFCFSQAIYFEILNVHSDKWLGLLFKFLYNLEFAKILMTIR